MPLRSKTLERERVFQKKLLLFYSDFCNKKILLKQSFLT